MCFYASKLPALLCVTILSTARKINLPSVLLTLLLTWAATLLLNRTQLTDPFNIFPGGY